MIYQILLSFIFITTSVIFTFINSTMGDARFMMILLVHFYFSLNKPKYIGYIWALINGILWDVITGDPLGLHSLFLIIITGITVRFHTFKQFSIISQVSVIAIISMSCYAFSTGVNFFNFRQATFSLDNLFINGILNALLWLWISPTCTVTCNKISPFENS